MVDTIGDTKNKRQRYFLTFITKIYCSGFKIKKFIFFNEFVFYLDLYESSREIFNSGCE